MMGFLLLALAAPPVGDGPCFATAHAIARGDVVTAADVTAVPCKPAARPALRYDAASGNPIANAALPAGTYLGRLAPMAEEQVPAGTELTLRSTAGVVTIERRVTAMQPGQPGRRMFVRDSSGEVFAVPLASSPK